MPDLPTSLRRGVPGPHRAGHRPDDSGIAMVITVMILVVVMTLLTVVFNSGVQALPLARHAQDYQAALQAADAGVEDYINRLDNNSSYYLITSDPQNPALSGWTPLPGTSVNEWFRYAVDNTDTAKTGVVHLIVSGAAGQDPATGGSYAIRTINVSIRLSGFSSFLYYTDYEIVDPSLVPARQWYYGNPYVQTPQYSYSQECLYHSWQWNTTMNNGYGPDPTDCYPYYIYFVSSDYLNGPVFSNDEIHVCGNPSFPDGVTTAYDQSTKLDSPGSTKYGGPGAFYSGTWQDNCYVKSSPSFGGTGVQPAGAGYSPFPATNTSLQSDLGASNDGGGCSYSGPITVKFNSDGTMDVTVPRGSSATAPSAGVKCSGTGIALPPNGLIYDANPTGCASSGCYADVYVSGVVKGQVTVASQNDITVTANLTDASTTGSDVIGLSATNSILLGRPSNPVYNLTIDAAMVALDHSIYLENWNSQPVLGTLTVYGSLAQEFRGPVGSGINGQLVDGYLKNYNWDPRLRYLQPPYFTSPVLPNWVKTGFAECPAVAVPTATTCS